MAKGLRMFGLTMDKLVVIGVIAAFLVGPQRLPAAAQKLAAVVRQLRALGETAKEKVREDAGDAFDDVDWKRLDPRQYDPRRIIRDALTDDSDT